MAMTRMLSDICVGKICEAHPQLARNARCRKRIDAAQCVKQRIEAANYSI
jgi:hypothetical protein